MQPEIALDAIDADALRVVERLRRADHAAYLVGGCVRDLLLGRKPKDFDIATSATPNEIRRLFRNCRIIGRRFRLAHIFFGPKIIETATFRANPRAEDDDGESAETESGDLLIRRDNVFGTAEEDARRRDFTINGLFFDTLERKVIDHVQGLPDLEARLVRTIGDPAIRFREDPIRMLRAVKFAARCDLRIEDETLRRLIEHRGDIARCPPARVTEEIFRLFRAGAGRRSLELLIETDILASLIPELNAALSGPAPEGEAGARRQRLWSYVDGLDALAARRPQPPSNALVLAVLGLPPLRQALDPATRGLGDTGQLVAESLAPLLGRVVASRRDGELARQILLGLRFLLPGARGDRRGRIASRDFYDDAVALADIVAASEGRAGEIAVEGAPAGDDDAAEAAMLRELESAEPARPRRDHRVSLEMPAVGRDGDRGRGGDRPHFERGPDRGAPRVSPAMLSSPGRGPTQIPDLPFAPAPELPPFLGTGAFGGPWAGRTD